MGRLRYLRILPFAGLLAVLVYAAVGCISGPIVECTGNATFPCSNGTCAISPEACPSDPGCPSHYPNRCDEFYCTQDFGNCPASGVEPAPDSPVVKAPMPAPSVSPSPSDA